MSDVNIVNIVFTFSNVLYLKEAEEEIRRGERVTLEEV